MILIISQNNERTTNEVIKWLSMMNKEFIRIHEDELFEIKLNEKKIFLKSERNTFFLDEIDSVWYRRGGLNFKRIKYCNPSINLHMYETQHWLEDYVRKTIGDKKHINKEKNAHLNKLLVLEYAQKIGLTVPSYFLADNTDDVILGKTIIKTINGNVTLTELTKNHDGFMYTSIIQEKEKEEFFISFFQENIEKDFEIRTFYLHGKCWSMAIFSQNDEQTRIDFRKYNMKKPNRNVKYNLPKEIENKIDLLMHRLDLNCGSLDFIKKGNEYYFLEVNSIGQFGDVSLVYNYQLEKEIADFL